jgi:hypothetical protein
MLWVKISHSVFDGTNAAKFLFPKWEMGEFKISLAYKTLEMFSRDQVLKIFT